MKLWDELLPQAEVTLNMLRSSALSVHVSAYQHLRGAWDWNRYPLAPLGMLVVTHDSADQRASWADLFILDRPYIIIELIESIAFEPIGLEIRTQSHGTRTQNF
jgi:hypothetical protein